MKNKNQISQKWLGKSCKNYKIILLCGASMMITPSAFAQQLQSEFSQDFTGADSFQDVSSDDTVTGNDSNTSSRRRAEFTPYIEVTQVAFTDFSDGSSDVLTYSSVAVGADASIETRRAQGQINVRYERLFGYDSGLQDQDFVTGLARGNYRVTRELSIEAGGIATRSGLDSRGPTAFNQVGNQDNVTQVYSAYAGPTVSTNISGVDFNAQYLVGYTRVESGDTGILAGGGAPIDFFSESFSQSANLNFGQQPGRALPFGWAIGAGFNQEDGDQLDQRFRDIFVRADVTVPLSSTLFAVGGIGYEDVEVSERDALRDAAGVPIADDSGRLITDEGSPRLVTLEEDGIIWDAGVLWRPSRRTSVEARFGRRFGSDTYTGSLSYQPNDRTSFNVSAFDSVSGFGSLINDNLQSIGTQFDSFRNPLSGNIGGCAFSRDGSSCFNGALQTAASANFRSRGITGTLSTRIGGWDAGIGGGYNRRRFFASDLGAQALLNGAVDENYFATAFLGRSLGSSSSIETNFYYNLNDSGIAGAGNVTTYGFNAAYFRQIIAGLSATAAVGVDAFEQDDFDDSVTASALLGLRYSF